MASTDLKSCSTENAGKFLNKEGKPASGDASRLESTSYLNGNSVKTTAHEVVSSTTEPLAENKGSDVKKERVGMEISRKEEEEKCGITVEARSGHEKERHQQESELFSKLTPRKFGTKGEDTTYQRGGVLNAVENRVVEFKSLTGTQTAKLPWKIMELAKEFICGCLNGNRKGIIYFGVGDSQERCSKFKRGEILGLDMESVIDDVVNAFQNVLNDHIKSDAGPLQKGGEQNCVNMEFVPVVNQESGTGLYVVEIEVNRDWKFCKDHIYYYRTWVEKKRGRVDKDKDTRLT
ncbi:unnamed protein product [Porites lobata]|uniref:Schlafen AlbA-2 domain-containing protein n=1 Tax=Porites lobata TaxID=104759 RepID=A0ABN8N775_9CNID|nr:unnamed protein product [Porites lobata]